MTSAEEAARRLLDAILADKPDAVLDLFFPEGPFDALKDIAAPSRYHKQLVAWFVADVHKEHAKLKEATKLAYDGFVPGSCKWKEVGTEANKIPYWSCYRNKFFGKTEAGKRVEFELRAMINWGQSWYVTHLGKPP
jgi:hypothetical protein